MNLKWIALGLKVAPVVIGAVHAIEKVVTGLKGQEKQDAAVTFAGEMLALTEGAIGRDLLNDAAVQAATRKVIDAYIELQNVIASRPSESR